MIFNYCNKTMSRVERTLWRVRDLSSILSSFFVLLAKNRRLLLIMMVIFPFRWALKGARLSLVHPLIHTKFV